MSPRIDWPALMRAGIGGLRLTPAEFWALTPVELQMMLGAAGGADPMRRSRLEALMQAFPDQDGETRDDRYRGDGSAG